MSRGYESPAPAPAPTSDWSPRSSFRRAAPRIERAEPPKPQIARLPEQPKPLPKPIDPAQRPNPLATLLSDPTLRKGDVVMFPDGPRVFRGEQVTRHAMADFVAASKSKDMAKSTRKVLAGLPVGENSAWSSDTVAAKGRLAQGVPDVETTGTLPKSRSRR